MSLEQAIHEIRKNINGFRKFTFNDGDELIGKYFEYYDKEDNGHDAILIKKKDGAFVEVDLRDLVSIV